MMYNAARLCHHPHARIIGDNTYAGGGGDKGRFVAPAASQCVTGVLMWTRCEHSHRCQTRECP